MGAHPRVCRPLKEWLHDTCAVELLAQRNKPYCLVDVSARGNQTIEMFRLHMDSGEVILTRYESTALTFRCPSDTPRQQRVRAPTKVTIPRGCGVETAEWALPGIDRGQNAVHLHTTKFREILCMNITWPEAPHAVILRQLETRSRVTVSVLEVNDWKPMGCSAFVWDGEDDTLVYLCIGVAAGSEHAAMLRPVLMVV